MESTSVDEQSEHKRRERASCAATLSLRILLGEKPRLYLIEKHRSRSGSLKQIAVVCVEAGEIRNVSRLAALAVSGGTTAQWCTARYIQMREAIELDGMPWRGFVTGLSQRVYDGRNDAIETEWL